LDRPGRDEQASGLAAIAWITLFVSGVLLRVVDAEGGASG
jgi:hypothetical protein